MAINRTISLSEHMDARVRSCSREELPNLSALVAELLDAELTRIEQARDGLDNDVVTQRSGRDGTLYRFRGRFLAEDEQGAYYAPTDGGDHLILIDANEGHPERIENRDIVGSFGEHPVPEAVAREYGLDAAVWL